MAAETGERRYGKVFDGMAGDYDRHRPAYPEPLLDHACLLAGLGAGDRVLELGCGTGQLTRSLLARELVVTAVEPGAQLIALAAENLRDAGQVEFVNERFEDASLPCGEFRALFCASAFHWIDPDRSWQKVADVLGPGGTLVLVSYFGLREERTRLDLEAQREAILRVAPELAARWPEYRDLEGTVAGAEERRANVSEVWSWLSSHELARPYAAGLFEDAQIAVAPRLVEQTAEQSIALFRTTSIHARLSVEQQRALEAETVALYERLGRPIRSSTVAVVVTARVAAPAG